MRKIDALLGEYAASHTHPINKLIHRIAVPIIAVDMLGMVRAVPSQWLFGAQGPSFAEPIALLALAYYWRLSPALAIGMGLFAAGALTILAAAQAALPSLFVPALVAIFVVAWAAQFYGHALEGKRPSFFRDLQFLLIGPLWLLDDASSRFGLAYSRSL